MATLDSFKSYYEDLKHNPKQVSPRGPHWPTLADIHNLLADILHFAAALAYAAFGKVIDYQLERQKLRVQLEALSDPTLLDRIEKGR